MVYSIIVILRVHILIYDRIPKLYVCKVICMCVRMITHITVLIGIIHVRIEVVTPER